MNLKNYLLIMILLLTTGCDKNKIDPKETNSSIKIELTKTNLNKDENISIKLIDSNDSEITSNIVWKISPEKAIIKDGVLTATDNGVINIEAIHNGLKSAPVSINISWVVNGITLPEEPDKALNDSTLAGIDSNKNGVRDDIERHLYKIYKNDHPIHIDIGMQEAKTYQYLLEHPNMTYDEIIKTKPFFDAPGNCERYYRDDAEEFGDKLLFTKSLSVNGFIKKYFNTKERYMVFYRRDKLLSGGSYSLPWPDELKKDCDFNTSKYKGI